MSDNTCRTCGGSLLFLGKLGAFDHSRCRQCGLFSFVDSETGAPRAALNKPTRRRTTRGFRAWIELSRPHEQD